jgi:hypothetical protein
VDQRLVGRGARGVVETSGTELLLEADELERSLGVASEAPRPRPRVVDQDVVDRLGDERRRRGDAARRAVGGALGLARPPLRVEVLEAVAIGRAVARAEADPDGLAETLEVALGREEDVVSHHPLVGPGR